MKVIHSITEAIGNTPLLKLEKLSKECGSNIYAKCEFFNPTSSVKDRIALGMIEDALQNGTINQDTIVIEPTSGNTGVGLAAVCAAKNIKLILTMPESMSIERRRLMKALGAELVLTPKEQGMKGAVNRATELQANTPNSIILQQFQNASNPKAHREHTALEILDALENKVDIFISAVGTGGTLSGVGSVLKQRNPNAKIIAVEPINSAVLSGEAPGPHKIQGIGAGFIPDILDKSLIDTILKVDVEWAYKESREIAKNEGILVGISSGANLWAAREVAKSNPGKNIVTILCDTGERYLSTELYTE
ncbi:cysteine synthase A [Helicobacter turcicus]|uniref:Cysteine synthase n=1 Tax=Helicobacter turcicus TaxID=2867412 RepID=A0ABS7JKI2_9HELI|nr:cysteine synthase A [Helicobacter turcicus]MBX7489906.1 cysteine synthase A [Helicobacter turcicus]MBX7544766.1 cysteine synthase A [Helicobacter turcicus]